MVATLTADAVTREVAWLTTWGDNGLPALLTADGGPWDVVQAYYPRTPYEERTSIYVLRRQTQQRRLATQRIKQLYPFRLICWWPLRDVSGSAEVEQQNFDTALDLLLQRILGPLQDKTHGGRFLVTGEAERLVDITYTDPERTIPQMGGLRAEVTYTAWEQGIVA